MKFFSEKIKFWTKLKKDGHKLPIQFSTSTIIYARHTDKQRLKFEMFCRANGIKLIVK